MTPASIDGEREICIGDGGNPHLIYAPQECAAIRNRKIMSMDFCNGSEED